MARIKVKIRKVWLINPRTRKVKSKKVYSRAMARAQTRKLIENDRK